MEDYVTLQVTLFWKVSQLAVHLVTGDVIKIDYRSIHQRLRLCKQVWVVVHHFERE